MGISIFTLVSPLHDQKATRKIAEAFLGAVQVHCVSELVNCGSDFSQYGNGDLNLVYVMTGGTEGLFLEVLPQIKGHVYILTSGKSNSLAASMEILSYLRSNGRTGEIIHGDVEYVGGRIDLLARVERGKKALAGMRLGVIGEPSDWLISSAPDEKALCDKLGMEVVRIPIAELIEDTRKVEMALYNDPATELQARLDGANHIYESLRRIIGKYNLQGITLRCFDLLDTLHNTGCLALARLNAEGVPASCEGDVPALVTMAIGNALTGQSGFQVNLSRINQTAGEYLFAHCTVPLNMVSSYTYDTHFESGLGIAIRGVLPEGNATIFKVSGDLGSSFVAPAQLLRNQAEAGLCRTQVIIQMGDAKGAIGAGSSANYFLKRPIGNHHVIFCGDYAEIFNAFMEQI